MKPLQPQAQAFLDGLAGRPSYDLLPVAESRRLMDESAPAIFGRPDAVDSVDDSWTATAWAAERFAAVSVGGDSAGGALAAAVALRAREHGLPLRLQLLVYPILDHDFETESYREFGDTLNLTRTTMEWFWRQYLPDEAAGEEPEAAPLRAPDLRGVAPALVLIVSHDPLRTEAEEYARRLEEAGVPTTLLRYDGQVHGFMRMPAVIEQGQDALDAVAAAVRAA